MIFGSIGGPLGVHWGSIGGPLGVHGGSMGGPCGCFWVVCSLWVLLEFWRVESIGRVHLRIHWYWVDFGSLWGSPLFQLQFPEFVHAGAFGQKLHFYIFLLFPSFQSLDGLFSASNSEQAGRVEEDYARTG